jgi:hypothetical protein
MKRPGYLLALAIIAFAGCQSNGSAQSLNTLREIKIERRTVLTLGGKMPSTVDFCNWNGTTCALKPGTFSGTKKMSLSVTESGLISRFNFDYGVTTMDAVQAQIDNYTHLLGKPLRDSASAAGISDFRKIEWSDSITTFEFSYKADGSQAEASAILSDNALNASVH